MSAWNYLIDPLFWVQWPPREMTFTNLWACALMPMSEVVRKLIQTQILCYAGPKNCICSLVKWADTAFCLCTTMLLSILRSTWILPLQMTTLLFSQPFSLLLFSQVFSLLPAKYQHRQIMHGTLLRLDLMIWKNRYAIVIAMSVWSTWQKVGFQKNYHHKISQIPPFKTSVFNSPVLRHLRHPLVYSIRQYYAI